MMAAVPDDGGVRVTSMKTRSSVRTGLFICVSLLAGWIAPRADAQPLPMTGETFAGTSLRISGTCTGGNLDFTSIGSAAGPYTGEYIESGTFGGTLGSNPFSAFWEVNVAGVVIAQGTKTGTIVLDCSPDSNVIQFEGTVFYNRTIPSPDSGVSIVKGFYMGNPAVRLFSETFVSTVGGTVVMLSPLAAENPVGTSHTVTATVVNSTGTPVPGQHVQFTVEGSVDTTGQCTTGANGTCTFTYGGPTLPGADAITATTTEGAVPGAATKAWVLPATEPGQVTGGGHILHMGRIDGASFGFTAKSDAVSAKGSGNFIDHVTKTKIHLIDVTTLMITGTHATFFGNARIDDTETTYRVDVDDLATPGRGRDTFSIQTLPTPTRPAGYAASGVLTGGNIQIHQ